MAKGRETSNGSYHLSLEMRHVKEVYSKAADTEAKISPFAVSYDKLKSA
jgi:hypothetical protein